MFQTWFQVLCLLLWRCDICDMCRRGYFDHTLTSWTQTMTLHTAQQTSLGSGSVATSSPLTRFLVAGSPRSGSSSGLRELSKFQEAFHKIRLRELDRNYLQRTRPRSVFLSFFFRCFLSIFCFAFSSRSISLPFLAETKGTAWRKPLWERETFGPTTV